MNDKEGGEEVGRKLRDTANTSDAPQTDDKRSFETFAVDVYVSASSAAATTSEKNTILEIAPIFHSLDEPVLYAYANDTEPIGPRIEKTGVPESTLKALAGYELERRKNKSKNFKWWVAVVALPAVAYFLRPYLENFLQ